MTDFSRIGLYFITARIESYREGMQLYVIPAFGCFNFEYLAEVVRVKQLPFGEYGIAVRLIRIGNPIVDASTVAKSAFQSFAHVGQSPESMSRQDWYNWQAPSSSKLPTNRISWPQELQRIVNQEW